jgi:2-polyprenyl-6-methoxyphenol hydroxylase-like FAD-dependent oxidoreductase
MKTGVCIAGGGPAGMMLGLLLARAGVQVTVMEKHSDFLRDFRGDTIHPSTLEVIAELGMLEAFLRVPHQKVRAIGGKFGAYEAQIADFSRLPVRCPYIAMMPQWDFLDFLAGQAKRYPGFTLRMGAELTSLQGIEADLIVGADGRHSTVRALAGLQVEDLGAPIDVLWFRLPRRAGDTAATMGRFDAGRIIVMIERGEYYQCAFVIPKGAAEEVRRAGLPAFRDSVAHLMPFAADRVAAIADWEQVKLLTVKIDRLRRWHRDRVLCIGDAAHAMSPVGGVGINLAIQDAVAAANILAAPLRERRLASSDLEKVQRRREWPTRVTQRLQLLIQDRVIARVLRADQRLKPPLLLRLLTNFPPLRRIPGRLIGMGVRPEHVALPPMNVS